MSAPWNGKYQPCYSSFRGVMSSHFFAIHLQPCFTSRTLRVSSRQACANCLSRSSRRCTRTGTRSHMTSPSCSSTWTRSRTCAALCTYHIAASSLSSSSSFLFLCSAAIMMFFFRNYHYAQASFAFQSRSPITNLDLRARHHPVRSFDNKINAYSPHNRDWIKQRVLSHLKQQAGQ